MAFNFYGTYTTGQYYEFLSFSKVQESDIRTRIKHLEVLITKYGKFEISYDSATGNPLEIKCVGDNSYGAKLLRAYKILGGDPESDFIIRPSSDPVYLKKGNNISKDPNDPYSGYGSQYSDSRLDRGNLVYDRDLGELILRQKKWQMEAIKRKREQLEYKIKRVMYLSQQLNEERVLLNQMLDQGSRNNLDVISARIQAIQLEPGRLSVVDNDDDIHGLHIGREYDAVVTDPEGTDKAHGERGAPT